MIKKVAEGLSIFAYGMPFDEVGPDEQKHCMLAAELSVRKMREPTNQMLVDSGTMTGFCNECSHLEADDAHIEWWKLMIDAALANKRPAKDVS